MMMNVENETYNFRLESADKLRNLLEKMEKFQNHTGKPYLLLHTKPDIMQLAEEVNTDFTNLQIHRLLFLDSEKELTEMPDDWYREYNRILDCAEESLDNFTNLVSMYLKTANHSKTVH